MKIKTFLFIFGLLILICAYATADTELNGFIKSDNRLLVSEDELTFVDIYNTLRLKVNAEISDEVSAFSSLDLRYHNFSTAENPTALRGDFLPDEESIVSITAPDLQGTPQTEKQTMLKDELYFKYTIGLDYTFEGGIYINAQYMHGFFHERGQENLEDYIIARIEKELFGEKLKAALNGGVEIKEFDDMKNNIGYIVVPELTLKPADSVEIALGAFLLDGKESTLFGQWKDQDQAYLKVKVDF